MTNNKRKSEEKGLGQILSQERRQKWGTNVILAIFGDVGQSSTISPPPNCPLS
jgi:hypothetical protein